MRQAAKLITEVTDHSQFARNCPVPVMGDKMGSDELYFHSLNVTMLSMMVARDLKLPVEVAARWAWGLDARYWPQRCPTKSPSKPGPAARAERNFSRCTANMAAIGKRMLLAPTALAIIREHHRVHGRQRLSGQTSRRGHQPAGALWSCQQLR
ncbi:MAG: hypothetical protein IPH54_22720 [Rhodoferax sp.]|nr:hypothetical protein [Rhodoferax sp.]